MKTSLSLLLRLTVASVAFTTPARSASAAASKSSPTPPSNASAPTSAAAILQELRSFATVATVLHIAAHPDDENTALITYLARGRGYRTGYLSLTRGDGGQNEIGAEFDEKLGVARTQELIAARKLDGGRQFFTRAIDFGYSKTPEETLAFWDRKEVLGDVVRVIREFRPDVLVTRFSPTAGGTHGHHTASAILAVEAFKLADDPKAYPEQLTQGLTLWQPKRVFWNGYSSRGGGSGSGAGGRAGSAVQVDIGGKDPVTGEGFGAIASRSRAMHITQFGLPSGRSSSRGGGGDGGGTGPNEQTFVLLAGEPAQQDLLDGVDVTWARFPGGAEIGRRANELVSAFKRDDAAASVPALLALRAKLAALPRDPVIDDKRAQLDRILQACLGLKIETRAAQPEVVPGEELSFRSTVSLGAKVAVEWVDTGINGVNQSKKVGKLRAGKGRERVIEVSFVVPTEASLTQPYWLRQEGRSGISRVDDPKLIGLPENPPAFSVNYTFDVGGQKLVVTDEPIHLAQGPGGERQRRVDVIPPVSLRFLSEVSIFKPGSTRAVSVEVAAARATTSGTLQLTLPEGWTASPATQPFKLAAAGEKSTLAFNVTAPVQAASGRVSAAAEVGGAGGARHGTRRIAIDYAHLPLMLLQPPARARLVGVDVATRGAKVGYLPGAGDGVAEALEQLGYRVTTLQGSDLTAEKLHDLDAVVIGVRAFNERDDLKENLPGLFAYVENGGTVVAQYNRPTNLATETLGPYSLSIGSSSPQWRVTDERAPVKFLAPDHPALTTPNKIGPADFEGWVQERGLYFPSRWDEQRYTQILAMSDPGERPLTSGLLVARHGKGHYVYTGIAFFRQLPAGVPGAYRLLANLVSLGK